MMKNKKKLLLSILASTIFFSGISFVNAVDFGVGYASTGSGGGGGEDIDYYYEVDKVETSNYIKSYMCVYDYTYWTNKLITINGYDLNGNSLMETSLNIAKDDAVLAGTSMKLNIYETKTINWKVTKAEVQLLETRKVKQYICKFKEKTPPQQPIQPYQLGNDSDKVATLQPLSNVETISKKCGNKYYYSSYGASKSNCENLNPDPDNCTLSSGPTYTGYEYESEKDPVATDKYLEECQAYAAKDVISKTNWTFKASYDIKLSDSNDVGGSEMLTIDNETASKTITCKDKDGNDIACKPGKTAFTYKEGIMEDKVTAKFVYEVNKVCMNVKSSRVTYRDTNCEADEIEIENATINNLEYWNYFLPLNAKSNSNVEINMLPSSGGSLSEGECNYVMKNYPVTLDKNNNLIEETLTGSRVATSYINLINPKTDGKTFEGNYCYKYEGSDEVFCNEDSSDYAEMTNNNGCYLTSKIKIPIKQEFYNEVIETDDTGKEFVRFNGFNFYYKPIDINNPFPNVDVNAICNNGGTLTSLWSDWLTESCTKSNVAPVISNSYDQVTYVARNINAKEIRQYNAENSYTSWQKMKTNGTSEWITNNNNIIIRSSNAGSVYALGCGPANENEYLADGSLNLLYQKECQQ